MTKHLKVLPDDEPIDEIPDFDVALESEVSLDRIPEDLREQIIKQTPNAEIEGDKLVMRDKVKLPTYSDKNLTSARIWKSLKPTIKENLTEVVEAKRNYNAVF